MSTFAFESVNLIGVRELAVAGLSIILNVGAAFGAIILGRAVVTLLLGLGRVFAWPIAPDSLRRRRC